MLKYLKNATTSSTTVGSAELILKLSSFANVVTISNATPSINSTTGALIVSGGIGTSGNINAAGDISTLGNIKAITGTFASNLTVQGYTTSNYITVPGILTATTGEFTYLYSNSLTISGQTITDSLEVINNGNFGSISSNVAIVDALTATTLTGLKELTTDKATAIDLHVDNIYPNTGTQVNLGSIDGIRIIGGNASQVIGTDGNGNLSWVQGTGAITVGTGLQRDGDVIGLSGTGFIAGTFNQVTIDQYGRVVSATNFVNDLQDVTNRSATTNNSISITNATESGDTTEGALVVLGGVGVGGTVTTQSLVVKTSATIEGSLTVTDQLSTNSTVNFNATQVPIKISSGTLVTSPSLGSIEFDGSSLYITTNVGRQLIQVKNSQLSASVTFVARAVAARNINIASATQYTVDGEDNWDDVILELLDVVLLTKQTNLVDNGLYVWNTENSALTRHPDFNTSSGILQGTIIFVSEGIENGGSFYKITTPNPITIGTTALAIDEQFNADNIALSSLPKNATSGLLVRTKYGSVALREIQSNSNWITITDPTGLDGNIIINTSTVPVSAGGTGRSSITGWMKGSGTNIQGSATIPLADIFGAGTMASQNANNVSIIGGTIDNVPIGKTSADSANFTEISVSIDSYSAYFNSSDEYPSYLVIDNPPASIRAWDINAFTIEMWIYVNAFTTESTLIGNLVPSTNNWYWGFNVTTGRALKFVYRNTAGNGINWTSAAAINANQWHHVAFVKNAQSTSVMNIYVDGEQVLGGGDADGGNTGMSTSSIPIAIGVNYDGYITNLRVTTGVAIYTAPFTAPTSPLGLLLTTSLLTCQSADFADKSLNALTVTTINNVKAFTLTPFASIIPYSSLVLDDYSTGLLRVVGDSSLNGLLQVSGTIYKNGYEVLSDNDIIDGGTY